MYSHTLHPSFLLSFCGSLLRTASLFLVLDWYLETLLPQEKNWEPWKEVGNPVTNHLRNYQKNKTQGTRDPRGAEGKVTQGGRHGLPLGAHERVQWPGASVTGLESGTEAPEPGALGRERGARRREKRWLWSISPPEGGAAVARGAAAQQAWHQPLPFTIPLPSSSSLPYFLSIRDPLGSQDCSLHF